MATAKKRILIVTHAPLGSTKGNRITAERWAGFLQQSGHGVDIRDGFDSSSSAANSVDVLIGMHAMHSHDAICKFRETYVDRQIILCLTGTDLHLCLAGHHGTLARQQTNNSIRRANNIVLLEPEGLRQLPPDARDKATVIYQSAVAVDEMQRGKQKSNYFEVCVIGHLRDEKAPFLTARASRYLPATSKIRIMHFGAALDQDMQRQAEREMQRSKRYTWLGALPYSETQMRLARSHAMVLTSKIEGAPSVISEAIVNGIPILATRIAATIGLLGSDYPGLFPVDDEKELSKLMMRLENEPAFEEQLRQAISQLAVKFLPETEHAILSNLLS